VILLTWVASKNCSYREIKNATRVRKKHLRTERVYRKRVFAKTRIKYLTFYKIWGNYSHSKVQENALTLTLKGLPLFAHWRGSLNKIENVWFARVASAMRFKNSCDIGFSRDIYNGNLTEWSAIWSEIIRVISKSQVWFRTKIAWPEVQLLLYCIHFEIYIESKYHPTFRHNTSTNIRKNCTLFLSSYGNTSESLGEREMLWEHELFWVLPNFYECFY